MLATVAVLLKDPGSKFVASTYDFSSTAEADSGIFISPDPEATTAGEKAFDEASFIPYNNAPASVQALLAALEADALKALPIMASRDLATTLNGMTKAWTLCENQSKTGGKEAVSWKGPSAEFLEAFGVQATRRAAELNPQVYIGCFHQQR